MRASMTMSASLVALSMAFVAVPARADSADATCEVRKDGDTQRGASGPCTFSQRQGYIDLDLKNGNQVSLSPKGGSGNYKDQNGNKVTRSINGDTQVFRWESGKKIIVTYRSAPPAANNNRAPRDVSDLVGMRGSSVDGELEQRGYSFIKKVGIAQFWWNRDTKSCISVAFDDGKVSDIQGTAAGDCGHAGGDHSQTNGALVPGAPAAAQNACAARGDEIWVLQAGSTVPVKAVDYGQGNYEITVAAGNRQANCSVNARGNISDFLPQ